MKSMSVRNLWFAGALAVAVTGAQAEPIHETRPLDADGFVTIKNINGTVNVSGWDKKEIEITGTVTGDARGLDISGSQSRLTVEVDYPEHGRHIRAEADLDVKLPKGAGLRVEVVNAPITVDELQGDLELQAVNGDITVDGKPSRIDAQTVNGDIEITGDCRRVDAQTVGGRVILTGISGDVEASTVGGTLRIDGGTFDRVRFSSVSGEIDFTGGLSNRARLEAESHSGYVTIQLPANVSADFDAATFSGDIDNDFGPAARRNDFGPGRKLSFSVGGGDARVRLNSFSGDIRILKK